MNPLYVVRLYKATNSLKTNYCDNVYWWDKLSTICVTQGHTNTMIVIVSTTRQKYCEYFPIDRQISFQSMRNCFCFLLSESPMYSLIIYFLDNDNNGKELLYYIWQRCVSCVSYVSFLIVVHTYILHILHNRHNWNHYIIFTLTISILVMLICNMCYMCEQMLSRSVNGLRDVTVLSLESDTIRDPSGDKGTEGVLG